MQHKKLFKIGVLIIQLNLFDVALHAQFLNVDFGSGTISPKVGLAATGQSTNDYWNFYSRDDGSGGYRPFGAVSNLKWADGTVSAVGLTVTNAPGAWENGAADPMYNSYLYPFNAGSITVAVTNLPVGNYDFLLYGHGGPGVDTANSVFRLGSGTNDYGTKATTTNSGWNSPVWQEGQQYVVFRDVGVTNVGESVTITVLPGAYGQAFISGMQVVRKSSTPGCVTPFPGLVGWWKGDGNANDAFGTNNGTLSGNATFGSGLVGQAFSFDGNSDGVLIGNPAALQLQSFSIEAWIRRASTNQASLDIFTDGGIFGYGFGGYLLALLDDGRLTLGKVGSIGVNSIISIRDTNWHHVAVTKAAGSVSFYVDGVGEAAPQFNPGFDFASSVQIGASQWDGPQPRASFLGSIDEVSVYNRSLSSSEMQALFNAGSAGKCLPGSPITVFANGSFESPILAPGTSVNLPAGSTTALTEWTVGTNGLVSFVNGPVLGVSPVDGLQHIGFNGADTANGGSISQTFSTTAGQTYAVAFHVGRIGLGTGTMSLHVTVNASGGQLLGSLDATAPASSGYGPAQTFNFTAVSETSALTFVDTSSATIAVDLLLDGVTVTPVPTCIAPPSALVGWWKGELNGIDAVGTNNGVLEGNATFAPGVVGQAFKFDGDNDGVMIGNPVALQLQSFTIEAWIKRASTNQVTLDTTFVAGTIFGYGYGGYTFVISDNGRVALGKTGSSAVSSTNAIRDTNWHHVAVTKSSGSVTLYVDGLGEAAQQFDPGFDFISSVQIGASQWDGTRPTASFLGLIDEVSVYNRALAASEIAAVVASASAGKCAPAPLPARALAHWRFDETNGAVAHDSTGGFDGNLSLSGASFVSGGVSGGALSLSKANNGFVNMGNVLGLENTDFSIVAWIRMTAGDKSDTTILSKAAAYSRNGYLLDVNKLGVFLDDKASFVEGGSGTAAQTIAETPISTTSVNDGNWHQIVTLYQHGGMKAIYVDGAPAEDRKLSQPFNQNSVAFLIGGLNFDGVPTGRYSGLIDEVQIYNYSLADADIDFLFQHPGQEIAPHELPPGDWRLNTIAGVGGTITQNPVLAKYTNGATVAVTATPNPGYTFAGWTGDFTGTNNPITIAMTTNKTVNANFDSIPNANAKALAHWRFDETNGTVAHDSAGPYDGNLSSSGAVFVAGGISGGALSLSKTNNGFVNMGDVLGLASGDFSIVAWVKLSAGDTANDTIVLSKHAAFIDDGYLIGINSTGGGGQVNKAVFYEGHIAGAPVSTNSVNDGNWHQIVAVSQPGRNNSIYVDGAPAEDIKPSEALIPTSAPFLIGGDTASGIPRGLFAGLIDEVQIYGFALSASNVGYLFTHPGEEIPSSNCAPAASGLVSWWPGEGNAADEVGGISGTPQNGATFAAGKVGQAFSFDGVDDQVVVPHSANQNAGSQITIDAWVNPSSSGHGPTILQKRSASNAGGYVFEMLGQPIGPDNGLQFVIVIGGTYYSCMTSNSVLTLNTWQHVAATYDGSAMRIYVNGVERASAAAAGAIDAVTDPIVIGRNVVFPIYAWQGFIDEVDLFNRALSSSEIQAIYNAGAAGKCSPTCLAAPAGLVSWWPAEGNGNDPNGGNSGNLQGNTSFVPGIVAQAFEFDGTGDGVVVGNPTNLQLQNFTIEAWIKRGDLSRASGVPGGGAIFDYGSGGYGFGMLDNGEMFLTRVDVSERRSDFAVTDTNWHHVAVMKSGSVVTFFIDGTVHPVSSAYDDVFTFTSNAAIGARGDNLTGSFIGYIDEVSIYDRPLSDSEVQSIHAAAGQGKCLFPPPITVSISPAPGFYTNTVTVTLEATSANTTIRYSLDGTSPTTNSPVYAGPFALTNTATVSALSFTNGVQASQVAVSTFRFWGGSSGCVAPAGAISWWTGDGDAQDALGLNRGSLAGSAAFAPGLIGQAFSFAAEGDAVTVANSPSLQLQNFTIEAWVKRRSTNQATLGIYGGGAFFAYGSAGYSFSMLDDGRLLLGKVGVDSVASTVVITNTSWHHVAITKSGTSVSFFVDGVSAGNAIYNSTFSFSSNPAIGATGTSLIASFYGLIDELAIYARPLATNEIQALFNAGASGKCPAFAPIVVTPPQNRTVPLGANTSFSVTAGGSPTLSYQWSLNGTPIPDATNALFAVTSVKSTNAGTYMVTVSNGFNPPATASATLTVSVPPVITQQPRSQVVLIGSTATFTVAYTGTPPLTFQWRRNGALVPGGSSPTLVINNVQSANAGTYTVRISNALNFVLSQPATLTVASGQFSALTPTANGIQLNVQGEAGGNYIIEISSDLKQWDPLATLLNNPPNWQYTDPAAPGVGQRFYRLRKSP